jgi:hypothetical protein
MVAGFPAIIYNTKYTIITFMSSCYLFHSTQVSQVSSAYHLVYFVPGQPFLDHIFSQVVSTTLCAAKAV